MRPAARRADASASSTPSARPPTPTEALRAGIHAFFALPRRRPRGLARALRRDAARRAARSPAACSSTASASRASSPPRCSAAHATSPRRAEPLSVALLGAAEALGRWWLRTGAIAPPSAPPNCSDPHPRTRTDGTQPMRTMNTTRRVAVIGGNRIPFARANGTYAHASDQDMLTATLDGLVERFALEGERARRGRRPAPCSSTRATATSRASRVLGSRLAPETPAYDVQQACGTGLEAVDRRRQQDRARADRRGHRGRRRHRLRRADRASTRTCATSCSTSTARSRCRRAREALTRLRPGQIVPEIPRNAEPRTGLSMGEHAALHGARLGRHARGAGRARRASATSTSPPPTTAASSTTSCSPTSASSATRTCARTRRREAREAQAGVRRRATGR